jgi:hypothetical protein
MARTVQLSDLRTAARQRADMENSQFISDDELNSYINLSAAELYDLIVGSYEEYYLKSYNVAVSPNTDTYPLPSDFYKLKGVDLVVDPAGNAVTLKPFIFAERNAYLFTPTWNIVGLAYLRYHIQGGNIRFVPVPSSYETIKLWYTPTLKLLVNDTDKFDGIDGWEEYIITDAAIKMLQKEESDPSVLLAQKAALIQRINGMAPNRDASAPERVSDCTKVLPWEFWVFHSGGN